MNTNQSKKRFVKATVSSALVASSIGAVVVPTSAATFTDLSQTNSHYENIMSLLERGIVSGYPDGTYRPNVAVTRGQAAKIIANTLNLDLENVSNPKFKDVPVNHQYYPYVAALVQAGILSGYSDQTFKPGATITRGQMAKMIALGFNLTADKQANFDDMPQNHQYASYVDALFSTNVTTGKTATTFDLTGSVTRGQLASFVVRAEKAITSAEATVTGTIENVTNNTVTINGKTYQAHKDVAFLVNKANTEALVNAEVTISTKGNEIIAVSSLNMKNGATFDGLHAKIADLKLPASMTTLKNISATTINYAVAGNVLIENVTAQKLMANGENGKVAATANVAAPVNLTINGSHFEVVQLISTVVALQKTASTIQYLDAKDAPALQLNGDFQTVLLSALTKLSGTAIIEKLEFSTGSIEAFEPISSIQVLSVTINGQTLSWADAIKQYLQPAVPTAPPIVVPAPEIPAPPVVEGNNGGNTDVPFTPEVGSNTDVPSTPEVGSNIDVPSTPEVGSNIDVPSTTEDSANIVVPSTPENGSNTDIPSTTEDSANIDVPEQGQEDSVIAQNVILVGDAIQFTDSVTNEVTTYTATEPVQQFFAAYSELITNVQLTISEGQVTAIEQAEVYSRDSFDGTALNALAIEQLTIQGASQISNITGVKQLHVVTTANTLAFNNVHANITATGNFTAISGAAGDSLVINSSASNVVIEDTSSTDITIEEGTNVAQLAGKRIATNSNDFVFAAETKMTIAFKDGDYSGQTLTINRKDTLVDVEGTPFTQITIKNNDVQLRTSGKEINRLVVAKNVTYLHLDANVTTFTVELAQALVIHSTAPTTIDELIVTAPTSETDGWLDFVNVTPTKVTLNGADITPTGATTDHAIFKKQTTATSVTSFSSALVGSSFGLYSFNSTTGITHYALIKDPAKLNEYKNATTLPSDAQPYIGNPFVLYADAEYVVAYTATDSTITGVSVAEAPSDLALVRLDSKKATGELTYFTRFADHQTPSETLKTIYIFKNGTLAKATNVTGSWTKLDNGINSITVSTGVTLTNTREVILGNNILSVYGSSVTTYAADYVKILKKVAELSKETNNTNLMKEMLDFVFSKTNGEYNSFFLTKYIDEIIAKASNLTTLADFESLIKTTNDTNVYDKESTLTATQLYLKGAIQNNFTYSTDGVVTNSVNDKGDLLFTPKNAGSTTICVTDATGLATLVHVVVDANKKITTTVLAKQAPVGTLLEGSENFRYDGTTLIAKAFTKENSTLKNASAVIQENGSTTALTRLTLVHDDSSYALSDATPITPITLAPTEFGMNEIKTVTGKNVGFKVLSATEVMFYPRFEGTELIFVGDGEKEVAVNTTTNTTIENFAGSIARSNVLTIGTDLNLLAVNEHTFLGTAPKNVFLYKDPTSIRVFAKDAFTGSVKLVDGSNTVTIVNITSTKESNKVTVQQDLTPVKTTLAGDANDLTVQHIDTPIVRANGLDLYAIGAGSATVTLSDGTQYLVTVNGTGNVYSMTADKVENLNITAAELHMTDIKEVLGAGSVQYVKNNSEAVISLATNTEAVVTLLSTNNEKTLIKVTKDADGYKYEPYRSVVDAGTVGLTEIQEVFNTGNTPTIASARASVGLDKDSNPNTNKLYIYNLATGNQTFRVTDGASASTALNVKVITGDKGFVSTPEVVKHSISAEYVLVDNAKITGTAARLVGTEIYATGLGLTNNKATIEVPLKNGANYVIGLNYDPDTGLYKFDDASTVTFALSYSKEELGLDTLTNATTTGSNIIPTVVDGKLNIAVKANTDSRIEVTGTVDNQTAKTFIYVTRTDGDIKANIERAEKDIVITETDEQGNQVETTKSVALDLNLKEYGYTTTPTGTWTVANVARATISADFKANFYALNASSTAFKLTDQNGQALLVNVKADTNNPRKVTATVVEENLSADLSVKGTIIEGDGVRLSADKDKVYATKVGATAKVKLSNGSYMLYEVTQNDVGQFELKSTPLTNIKVVTATDLGLTGNITATNLDTTIVAKTKDADSIVLTALKDGKTAMLVTDANGATALVNVEVNGSTVTTTKVDPVEATAVPTLLPNEPTSVVRIEDEKVHPLAAGTVHLLVGNEIQELTVSNTNGHFSISALTPISTAVFSKADLGFTENAAIEFETPANVNFYVGELQGKVVAYSKLTGDTTGSYEFVVKATDTGARTLIRLNDKGTALLEQQVAVKPSVTFGNATTVTFNEPNLARFDANNDALYLFKEGPTFVTANNHLHAVDITRDAQGYLTADVRQLLIEGGSNTFTSITGTDSTIIDVTANTIYAKAIGTTKVKLGNDILTITIGKDATGKYTMEKAVTTSKFVPVGDTHLAEFTTVEVIAVTANAVSLSKDTTGLTIFSNGATTAQSLLVRVTDGANNKAVINVTLDETGAISDAKVVSHKVENLKVSATETVKTDYAQAVWNGTTLTVYPLQAGNSTLEFANALVNVSTTADGNKLNVPTVTLLDHSFINMDVITNGAMINEHYFTAQGTGLVYTDNKVFSFGITKENNQYVKTISLGSAAVTLELDAIGGTFAQNEATLSSVKVIKDQVKADTDPEKLVIYTTGEGISDLTITQADGSVVYQVKSTALTIETPELAEDTLENTDFTGASVKAGDSLRLAGNTVYFLKEGSTALLKDDKLVNATVTRDADGYFTLTPTFVTATIKEKATGLTKFAIENDTTLVAKNGAAEETFYTENYRVTAKTTEVNNFYKLAVDERHMNTFNLTDYFAISDTVTVKAPGGNTNANAVLAEVVNGKLVIYAGETAGNALITFTNGTKEVTFNAIHGMDGTILATPQAAVDSLKFEDIGLSTTTHAITVENIFDAEIAEVTATATGLNVNAKKAGTTSVALKQNGSIVGFVNIKVESVNGNYKITSTPVTYEVNEAELFTTALTAPRSHDGKLYATATGKTLYGTGTSATSIVVTQNATTGLYSATKNMHTLATFEASAIHLDKITHISVNGSTVEAAFSSDNNNLYIYGLNNGTSEVVVSNGTQYATIVAKNGATLVTEIARKELETADFPTATWTTSFVEMRGGYIYATHAGLGVATADLGAHKVFMNINVGRKTDQTFEISYDIVDHTFNHNVTVLTGTSIIADGTRIFAQQAGTSTVEVNEEVYTVTVEEMTDGSYKLTVSEPVEAAGVTAAELGLTTITKTTIVAITGAGVVEAPFIKDDTTPSNSKVVLQAKYAGEAQVTVTDGTNSTVIHVFVENQNGELILTPTIAKTALAVAPKSEELAVIQSGNVFRVVDSTLFALKEGTIIAPIQGELHKLTAKKTNNILLPTAEKITATLPGTVDVPADSAVLKANDKDVIAIGFGSQLVTVDGTRSFRVTVNNDGSIVLEELLAKTVDLTNILNSVTNELTTESAVATIKYNGTTATIDPKTAGTETMTVSDGTNSVQIKVTVTDNNGTLSVVTEIPSTKLRTGIVGFYPTGITMPNGTAFTSKHGVIKLADGEITVYPGERSADSKAITTQVIVEGANKTALYELKINEDFSYSFAPFVQTIGYDAFKFKPEIFQKIGNSYAQIGETGLDISFEDTNETIFIVKGDTNADYKVLSVQASIDTAQNSFAAKTPEVYTAHTVVGEITNVNGLYVAKDGDTTIIFADSNTQFPASYTHNGIIYNVTKNVNVTETNKNQLVVTPLTLAQTPEIAATSARFIQGTDVAAIEVVDGTTKWAIKAPGTGIYKINDADYVTIKVDVSNNTYTLTKSDAMQTLVLEATATNAQVVTSTEKVDVDGNTVFGTSTEKIIVSAEKDGGKVIYTGKFATLTEAAEELTISKKLLAGEKDGETGLLGWTAFESTNLNSNSSILRIEGSEIYALGVGKETITFTSKNGLQRTVNFEVTSDYQLTVLSIDDNIVTYTTTVADGNHEMLFTFALNIPTNIPIVKSHAVGDVSITDNEINIGFKPGIPAVNTFTVEFPELSSTPIEFTITIQDITTVTISSSSPLLKFNKITE